MAQKFVTIEKAEFLIHLVHDDNNFALGLHWTLFELKVRGVVI